MPPVTVSPVWAAARPRDEVDVDRPDDDHPSAHGTCLAGDELAAVDRDDVAADPVGTVSLSVTIASATSCGVVIRPCGLRRG